MEALIQIEGQCRWCGPLVLRPQEVRCAIETAHGETGLCEFACPICQRRALVASTPAGVAALSKKGARHIAGIKAFEILEPHTGAALSWNDLLDLRLALESTSVPQAELAR